MISVLEACALAIDYLKTNYNINGVAKAWETAEVYIFDGGIKDEIMIGGVTVCIDKKDGQISVLEFPSKESTDLIKASTPIDIPLEFYGSKSGI